MGNVQHILYVRATILDVPETQTTIVKYFLYRGNSNVLIFYQNSHIPWHVRASINQGKAPGQTQFIFSNKISQK